MLDFTKLTSVDLQQRLAETFDEELLFLVNPEFDAAIVGVACRCGMAPVVVYSGDKIIQMLIERDGMARDEAVDYYSFNIEGAYVGERTPMFMSSIE